MSTSDDDNVTQNYFLPVKAIQRAEVTRTAAFFEHIRQLWSCTTTKGHRIRRLFFFLLATRFSFADAAGDKDSYDRRSTSFHCAMCEQER